MKLLLHIGTEKTGSTLLQDWLFANRAALSAQGVYFTDRRERRNNTRLVAYFRSSLDDYTRRHGILDQAAKQQFFTGFEDQMRDEIAAAAASHECMVISSEHFQSRLRQDSEVLRLRDFLAPLFSEVRILCYFREQSSLRLSLYSTALRAGETGPLETFHMDRQAVHPYYDFLGLARRWAGAFGREALDFRLFDRARFAAGDIRQDFLEALPVAVDGDALDFSLHSRNESMGYLRARAQRALNEGQPFWDGAGAVNRRNIALREVLDTCDGLMTGDLTDPNGERFAANFAANNSEFLAEYLPPDSEFPSPVVASTDPREQQLSLEEVGDIVAELTEALARQQSRNLDNTDADVLRDVALKAETGERVTPAQALALMRLAKRARPDGPLIVRKLAQWEAAEQKRKKR